MRRLAIFTLFAAGSFAQGTAGLFNKPPADVDQALRARITEFFEYHVKGEFHKAEALVAEDTKEYFYDHDKPKYLSFEISKIDYTEGFTKARAIILCEQYVMIPGFTDKPLKVPTPSNWKIENGKWSWYIDVRAFGDSPFGHMTAGGKPGSGSALPPIPASIEEFHKMVRTDKSDVALKPGDSDRVAVANGTPGLITVSVVGTVTGIDAKFDRTEVKAGEKAVLTVHAGDGAKSGSLSIHVMPTGQDFPVQVTVH